jgi:glutaryl-CoA dehydrogenase
MVRSGHIQLMDKTLAKTSPVSDFYNLEQLLTDGQREVLQRVRHFMKTKVEPIINEHWKREAFPHHLLKEFAELGIVGAPYQGYGCPGEGWLFEGFISQELSKVDSSLGTFYGVQNGLAMGSIYLCGSEEQKAHWLPRMRSLEVIGSFGLTEPDHGSDISKGLSTTAERQGDQWVLNGEKKWIGNGTFADLNVIWARDKSDGQVKGFLVEKDTPGFQTEKMEHKMALRVVQNAHIKMENCKVPESHRLQQARSFRDTAGVLRMTRAAVAWQAVGCAAGAYELALTYCKEREQFGQPIAGFQLVQDRLAQMLANVVSAQSMVVRLSQLQDQGELHEEHASLAKMFCTVKMRETVGLARELLGGNGILLNHHVGRFVADAEAIYSYEGTREINALIVGRAVTGLSAFR